MHMLLESASSAGERRNRVSAAGYDDHDGDFDDADTSQLEELDDEDLLADDWPELDDGFLDLDDDAWDDDLDDDSAGDGGSSDGDSSDEDAEDESL